MKVVILHQHFKIPQHGGAIRSYHLAMALRARKVDVEVITAHNGARKEEVVEGVTIHYLPVAYDNSFGFYRRVVSFLKFMVKAVIYARSIHAIDLCYAVSVPLTVGLSAEYLRRRKKTPFIFEVGDLWPDVPIQMGFIRSGLVQSILLQLERKIYHSARAVVALSPAIEGAIKKKAPRAKVYQVPNMADTTFYKPQLKCPFLEDKYNTKGQLVVSYIGTMGMANGLDYLLACARVSAQHHLNIRFVFCGEGALKKQLQTKAQQLRLPNITFLKFANREEVGEVMNITDVVFVSYKPVPILETGSPNKFFDGLAAGKLIVINFGGWLKKEIEDNHCGFYVSPNQPLDFVHKIKPFLMDKQRLLNAQRQSRQLAEKKYSKDELVEKLVQIVSVYASQPLCYPGL